METDESELVLAAPCQEQAGAAQAPSSVHGMCCVAWAFTERHLCYSGRQRGEGVIPVCFGEPSNCSLRTRLYRHAAKGLFPCQLTVQGTSPCFLEYSCLCLAGRLPSGAQIEAMRKLHIGWIPLEYGQGSRRLDPAVASGQPTGGLTGVPYWAPPSSLFLPAAATQTAAFRSNVGTLL